MQNQIETGIPFCGFYCSIYDSEFDRAGQNLAEYLADEIGASAEAVADELWSIAQWDSARDEVSRLHIEVFLEKFSDLIGVDILTGHKFAALQSPKYYNFSTDRIFARIDFDAVQQIFDAVQHATLEAVIKSRFTSYDGFISHYSNQLDAWLDKPLAQWDCNEIETLLQAAIIGALGGAKIDVYDLREFMGEVEMEVLDYGAGNGIFEPEFEESKLLQRLQSEDA